ncbi:MAG: MFS transporter [Acidimicrobiales bacterium]
MSGSRGGALRALRTRNYRLFFLGQVLSVIGTWTQNTALAWILLQEGDELGFGLIVALQFTPLLVLGAWAGAIADRSDKPRMLQRTNALAAMVALVMAVTVSSGHRSLPVLAALVLLGGCAAAFETPTRQSMAAELVPPPDLPSAVGLNGAIMTSSRLVGSALAGVLISTVGAEVCLYLNAVSFLAVVVAMTAIRREELQPRRRAAPSKGQIRLGLRYAAREPEVRLPLTAMAVIGTLALNQQVTTPLLARQTFHAGPTLFAAFGVISGAGALAGALTAAGRRQARAAHIGQSALLFGVAAIGVSVAPGPTSAMVLLAVTSFGASQYVAATNSRLQAVADPAFRARVIALYAILFLGSTPIGSLIVSAISAVSSPRVAIGMGGAATVITGAVQWTIANRRARAAPSPADQPTPGPAHAA